MTIGLGELIIILLVVLFVIALAFRTGQSRGRRSGASRVEREQLHDDGKHE